MKKQSKEMMSWSLVSILGVAAFYSLSIGIKGALTSSRDLQWAGAYLIRQNINPWQQAAIEGPQGIHHLASPNYLQQIYIFLLPISNLSFQHAAAVWCGFNILLSVASLYLLQKLFNLSRPVSLAMLFLLWISTPFRSTLELGQVGVVELFLLCLVFSTNNSTIRGIALGVSFSAYTFAPVTLSLLWFRRNIRTLAIAATVPLFGLGMTWGMLGGSLREVATAPFTMTGPILSAGMADLTSCIGAALSIWLPSLRSGSMVAQLAGLLLAGVYGSYLNRHRLTIGAQLTLVALASLFTTQHQAYDFVFLIVPLCYAASKRGAAVRYIAVPAIAAFWFLEKLFPQLPPETAPTLSQWTSLAAATCLLGTLLVYLTSAIIRIERNYDRRTKKRGAPDRRSSLRTQPMGILRPQPVSATLTPAG